MLFMVPTPIDRAMMAALWCSSSMRTLERTNQKLTLTRTNSRPRVSSKARTTMRLVNAPLITPSRKKMMQLPATLTMSQLPSTMAVAERVVLPDMKERNTPPR